MIPSYQPTQGNSLPTSQEYEPEPEPALEPWAPEPGTLKGTQTQETHAARNRRPNKSAKKKEDEVTLTERVKSPKKTQKQAKKTRREPTHNLKDQPKISNFLGPRVTPTPRNGTKGPGEGLTSNSSCKNNLKYDMLAVERESEGDRARGGNLKQLNLRDLFSKHSQDLGVGPDDRPERTRDQTEPRVVQFIANHSLDKASK